MHIAKRWKQDDTSILIDMKDYVIFVLRTSITFFFKCKKYIDIRTKYIKSYYWKNYLHLSLFNCYLFVILKS